MRLRNDLREQRIRDGAVRNAAWAALTPAAKLAALEVGARRQREKLRTK